MHNSTTGAQVIPSHFDDGWLLEINGDVQSHVDLNEPSLLRFEYLRRIGNVLDACWPDTQPITVLHLGAGALTLPRYLQVTRPNSDQTVVELDAELIELVTTTLPLPEGTRLNVVVGDAREQVLAMEGQRFDAIVVDIFTGGDTAEHLTGTDFYRELLDRLADDGVLLINVGDDEHGLRFVVGQARALQTVAPHSEGVWTLADASTLTHRGSGNAVFATGGALPTDNDGIEALRSRLSSDGPHPASVLTPRDTSSFLKNFAG